LRTYLILLVSIITFSCSVQRQIGKSAKADVLDAKALQTAHVGLSIFEPASNKYWFNYQGDKYFVPASNTKIPTCYAAMKYLGDSITGIRYAFTAHAISILPNGDPTFMLPEFKYQPILSFLQNQDRQIYLYTGHWQDEALGSGWSWNDYEEYYMAERSLMPIFGNLNEFSGMKGDLKI